MTVSRPPPSKFAAPVGLVSATVATYGLIAVVEGVVGRHPDRGTAEQLASSMILAHFEQLAQVGWVLGATIVIAGLAAASTRLSRSLTLGALVVVTAAVSGHAFVVLADYRPFVYPPFIALYIGLFAGLAAGYAPLVVSTSSSSSSSSSSRSSSRLALTVLVPVAAALGGVVLYAMNHHLFYGLYPSLHKSWLLVTTALLHLALAHLFLAASTRVPRGIVVCAAIFIGPVILGGAWSAAMSTSEGRGVALGYFRDVTVLGQGRMVGRYFDPGTEDEWVKSIERAPDAAARFAAASHLPALPPDFDLADYNILFVTIEALRTDETSIGSAASKNTPHLKRFADDGAFVYERAFSPSSGTFHSMTSLFSMTYPSHAKIETFRKGWHGELSADATTVAEHFARAGRETLWVGHNFRGGFHKSFLGIDQGFSTVDLVYSAKDAVNTDVAIADKAIAHLAARATSPRPFFLWLFFVSPHSDYVVHDDKAAGRTRLDKYRQEVRFADAQLGRVVDHLRSSGQLDRTIVIVTGDHGEEFGEHGGNYHKTTVYTESTNVPLVIRVPGLTGQRHAEVTSTLYVFPWLFQRGASALRAAADERLQQHIGPMLRETDGAVVVELIGVDRMRSALVWDDTKVNYDFISGRKEVFDIGQDRLEERDLFPRGGPRVDKAKLNLRRYRHVRAAHRAYRLDSSNLQ